MNHRSFIRNENGSTAVEFALVLIPLLLFIFGSIEFGLAIFNKQVITNATREGGRFGIVVRSDRCSPNDITAIENVVTNYSTDHLVTFGTLNNIVFDPPISCLDTGGNFGINFGDNLTVSTRYDYDFLFLSNFGIGPWQIESVSQMIFE